MSIFSQMAMPKKYDKLKRGEKVSVSVSDIASTIINLPMAKQNLSNDQYERILDIWVGDIDKDNIKKEVDLEGYYREAIKIVQKLQTVAPFENYSGCYNVEDFSIIKAFADSETYKNAEEIKEAIKEWETDKEKIQNSIINLNGILNSCMTYEDIEKKVATGRMNQANAKAKTEERDKVLNAIREKEKEIEELDYNLVEAQEELEKIKKNRDYISIKEYLGINSLFNVLRR